MIAIWIISFWQSLGSPKKFNLVELGAGNGEMMKIIIESFQNFPFFLKSCNFIIHEKSPTLINIQKKKLIKKNNFEVFWPRFSSLDLGIRLYRQFSTRNPIFQVPGGNF